MSLLEERQTAGIMVKKAEYQAKSGVNCRSRLARGRVTPPGKTTENVSAKTDKEVSAGQSGAVAELPHRSVNNHRRGEMGLRYLTGFTTNSIF